MAVYKVIQDVEAEDKLLGPLTLKGFVYAGLAVLLGYINFKLMMIGSPIKWMFFPVFFFPMVLFAVLASPLGGDQPTEVWLLSKIRFFLKPRLRIWDQSGIEELVTITAPKRIEQQLTDNLSQPEVKSRLKTLANTLDTRGWAIKNVGLNLNISMPQAEAVVDSSDRLIAGPGYSQPPPAVDVHAADDILDEQNNPTAKKFASMMQAADNKRKQNVKQTVLEIVDDGPTPPGIPDEAAGLRKNKQFETKVAKAKASFNKEHARAKKREGIELESQVSKIQPAKPVTTPVTPERQAVNMELAQSGSAFSVSTLSQLANRQPRIEQIGPNEVSISLH